MDPQLSTLWCDFFALAPTKKLKFPETKSLSQMNNFFVNDILLDRHFGQYSPSVQYQIGFWKWALQHLECLVYSEEQDDEIASTIYEHFVNLISMSKWRTNSTAVLPSPSYVTYFWLPGDLEDKDLKEGVTMHDYFTATLLESRTTIERGTTGFRTWLASFHLARYLIRTPEIVVSKTVLELGSGIGFLGIIVATLQHTLSGHNQPGTLWLTDINDEVLERCRENLRLPCNPSSSHPSVNYHKLDWCDSLVCLEHSYNSSMSIFIGETIHPDVVIGADIVFDPSLIPGVVGTIKISLERHATCALIALTVRKESTLSYFLSNLQESSLRSEELRLPVPQLFSHLSHSIEERVIIFRITKKQPDS